MRLFASLLLLTAAALAADRQPPAARAANEQLQVSATLLTAEEIRKELGSDLGGFFIVVKVTLTPGGEAPLAISRDDFLLRSYKDGQKSGAYAPTQIAGRSALVVSTRSSGGGIAGGDPGPVWGGIPGTGGRPQPIDRSPAVGSTGGATEVQATAKNSVSSKDDPLLAALSQKILPEKEIKDPLSGLLYFSLEGKHKPKDLVLQYLGPAGKLSLPFR